MRRRPVHVLSLMMAVVVVAVPAVHTQTAPLPTPESVLGFRPGADYKLATYEDVVGYFQKLDAASDRMMMVEAGTSTQGRTFHLALI
jgi:hypothetical protein